MIKDLPEGTTHYQNDNCGEPAHNKMNQEQEKCKICKCTNERACRPNGCNWIEFDLCSACVDETPEGQIKQNMTSVRKSSTTYYQL